MELDDLQQQTQMLALDLAAARTELQVTLEKGSIKQKEIARMELNNASEKYQRLLHLKAQAQIEAPFAGIVGPLSNADTANEPLHPGARVSQGQALLILTRLDRLHVVTQIEEIDVNQLRVGQQVAISAAAFEGIELQGTVHSIAAQAIPSDTPGSANYQVRVALPPLAEADQQRVRLGMSARLSIITYHNDQAMIVPANAVNYRDNRSFITFRQSMARPVQTLQVNIGRPTVDGVEVMGLPSGLVCHSNNHCL
jgi:hypothetical protein